MAFRATVHGRVHGVGFRDFTQARARDLGVSGWVRNEEDGTVRVHAEGTQDALDAFVQLLSIGPATARVDVVDVEAARTEGHEQFAIRGVAAGRFLVCSGRDGPPAFELRLQLGTAVRVWTLLRAPSMDPAVRRLALAGPDAPAEAISPRTDEEAWDAGHYEQGGRVPWPEALARGHAVVVLHGQRLQGGFALQRTGVRSRAGSERWLLIKRRE